MYLFIIIIVIDMKHSLLNSDGSSIKTRQTTTFHSWIEINAIHHHYSLSEFRSKNVNIRFELFRCRVLFFSIFRFRFRVGAPFMDVAPMMKQILVINCCKNETQTEKKTKTITKRSTKGKCNSSIYFLFNVVNKKRPHRMCFISKTKKNPTKHHCTKL